MSNIIELKIGDKIKYRPRFGRGIPVEAVVTAMEYCEDGGKYGEPIDDYCGDKDYLVINLDDGHWAYGYQIDRVVS